MRGPIDDPVAAGCGGEQGEGEEARWVRSFLLAQPGKTYRIEPTDHSREAPASEAVEVAARSLTDEVVRRAGSVRTAEETSPTEPS